MSNLSQTDGKHCEIGQLILKVGTQWKISDLHASPVEILVGQSFVSSSRSCEISFYRRAIFKSLSPPQASKVHCSINGLENSSSTEYSKVQHLFGIAVGLFPVGGGLFPSPPVTRKKFYSNGKESYCNLQKVLDLSELEFSSPFMEQWTLDARGVLWS